VREHIFWLTAMLSCVTAFWFAIKHKSLLATSPRPVHLDLAKGQEKDNWLTCGVVWAVVLSGTWQGKGALMALGAVCMVWIVWRTWRRLRLLAV
jgi:hypothetical protein